MKISCWSYVLVDAKKIVGIKFPLDQRQAFVLVSIGGTDSSFALVLQIVYIHRARRERLHCAIESLDPGPRFLTLCGLAPIGVDPELKARASKTEGIVMRLGAPRSMPVHHRYAARFMRRIRSVFDNGLDNIVCEPFEMARSSMT